MIFALQRTQIRFAAMIIQRILDLSVDFIHAVVNGLVMPPTQKKTDIRIFASFADGMLIGFVSDRALLPENHAAQHKHWHCKRCRRPLKMCPRHGGILAYSWRIKQRINVPTPARRNVGSSPTIKPQDLPTLPR